MSAQDPSPSLTPPRWLRICISLPCPALICISGDLTLTQPLGRSSGARCPPAQPHLPTHRLLKWIEDGIPKDPFLNPDLMKNNPWVEKGKCAIL